jgi:hypothetical protein
VTVVDDELRALASICHLSSKWPQSANSLETLLTAMLINLNDQMYGKELAYMVPEGWFATSLNNLIHSLPKLIFKGAVLQNDGSP